MDISYVLALLVIGLSCACLWYAVKMSRVTSIISNSLETYLEKNAELVDEPVNPL